MVRKMSVPAMELVDYDGPGTQMCVVMDEIGKISMKRALIPEPKEGEVRVKVKWVGICGATSRCSGERVRRNLSPILPGSGTRWPE
ncbi:hypothetical protein LJK88_27995 [Paenibacillus sp. P26]|nr:hypothetical protein LJK88_27995 [Paenibacillus sp. P26]